MKIKRRIKKQNKINGITLISLVVTIVVLLILAGVTLNLVIGDNGIIEKALDEKEQTEQEAVNDQIDINSLYDELASDPGGNNNGGNNNGGNTGGQSLPSTGVTTPYLPSDEFIQVEGTNLDNGLVIQDTEGNQYVWIEVPRTTTVYPTAGLEITEFTEDECEAIENDLHTYTTDYRDTSYSDTYYADSTEGWFKEEEYYATKNKMLKSVYQNGGFWIGRYEAGIEKNRTAKGDATTTPASKANMYPYTYVTRTQAKVLAEKVQYGSYTGSLMFGVQWDLVLKYIETKQIATNANIQNQLNSDSTNIGNYRNSAFKINRGKYAQHGQLSSPWKLYTEDIEGIVEDMKKISQTSYSHAVLLTTGASDKNCLQNIYDLAGNILEWTLENTSSMAPFAVRGGNYIDDGSDYPVSYRYNIYYGASWSNIGIGFRLTLY